MKQKNKASGSPKSSGQMKGKGNRKKARIGYKKRWVQLEVRFKENEMITTARKLKVGDKYKMSEGSDIYMVMHIKLYHDTGNMVVYHKSTTKPDPKVYSMLHSLDRKIEILE